MRTSLICSIATVAALGLMTTACGSDTEPASSTTGATDGMEKGPPVDVGDGQAYAFVTVDGDGNPEAIGIRFNEGALENIPEHGPDGGPTSWPLELPDAASSTAFQYVTLDWNAHGHEPPGIFDLPHFDMHFYFLNQDEVAAINPTDPEFGAKAGNLPDEAHRPAGFVVAPGPPPEEQGVPLMGLHWLNSADPIVPGEFVFNEVMITGSWDGEFTFIEPMMTRAWLLEKQSVSEDLGQPEAYPKDGYYPTTYSVEFDEASSEYVVTLGGMVERQGS
jgi:hypothetical protein